MSWGFDSDLRVGLTGGVGGCACDIRFRIDGPVRYDVIAATAEVEAVPKEARVLARDIHDRGTFAASGFEQSIEAGIGVEPIPIPGGVIGSLSGNWFLGTDAVTGEPSQNFGN